MNAMEFMLKERLEYMQTKPQSGLKDKVLTNAKGGKEAMTFQQVLEAMKSEKEQPKK